jgi:large subunit ribosomal protein L18
MARSRKERRKRRRSYIRKRIFGTPEKPRVAVFKSNKYLYAQLIDDLSGETLCGINEKKLKAKKDEKPVDRAFRMGKEFGKLVKDSKTEKIVFDRGGFKYHGRVKSFAEGLRESGINF